ncbi:MAG: hypothetical protein EOP48_32915 [Sphingobacteriales bacterium]|nr:MAG: hypothetical protein EOP48_32915 [Sphingobacteriales bacterium]
MKRNLLLILLLFGSTSFAQETWFSKYSDSAKLVQDANSLITEFVSKVNTISPVLDSQPLAILNTKPYLIFYSPKSNRINLPIWYQVGAEQKKFFAELAGGESKGEEMFGYFFNGFYLPHELGHTLQHASKRTDPNLYQNEYVANTISILYWRDVKRFQELKRCYEFAKNVVKNLPSPVPQGIDPIKYFNENYSELGADPYKYGYYQFAQFIEIYEDKSLKPFAEFVTEFLSGEKK